MQAIFLVLLLSITFSPTRHTDEIFEESEVGASGTEIMQEEMFDDDAAWILEEERALAQAAGGSYTKLTRKHCARQLMSRRTSSDTLEGAKRMCDAEAGCGGVYDSDCDNDGRFYLCRASFRPSGSRSSCVYVKNTSTDPTPPPSSGRRPDPTSAPSGGNCLASGSCSNSVAKCGHCLYSSQCEGNMYCCPYMKKCVVHGGTPCFTPIAECIPPCRENSPGYPGSCSCGNSLFPNDWYNTPSSGGPSAEEAIAGSESMENMMVTSDEIKLGSRNTNNVQYIEHDHGQQNLTQLAQYFLIFVLGIFVAGVFKTGQNKFCQPVGDEFESLLVEEI
jgi:hypothetical protein